MQLWPTTVKDGVALIVSVATLAGIVGGALNWWLRVKLNGMGKRLKIVEEGCTKNTQAITDFAGKQQATDFAAGAANVQIGEVKGLITGLTAELREHNERAEGDARKWIDRLARIETKLGITSEGK